MKNAVIIDASIAIKWVLTEENSDMALALLAKCINNYIILLAPALLAYEAANTLYHNVLRGKFPLKLPKQDWRR